MRARCDVVIVIAMSLFSNSHNNFRSGTSMKDPFILPTKERRKFADSSRVRLSGGSQSDYVTMLHALQGYDQSKKKGGNGGAHRYASASSGVDANFLRGA